MKLLIVEDETGIRQFLRQGFGEAGFTVDTAATGPDALKMARTNVHDAIVLDVVLPGISGLDILKSLREEGSRVPVILLTARDSVDNRVEGLDSGADDYLIKPFAFNELLARVRSLLRRGSVVEATQFEVADLTMDLLRHRVTRAGRHLSLTVKEFALLEFLVRHRDEVLPRSLIASQLWNLNFDSDSNVVDVAIRRLRAKVDDPFERKLIKTERGMGYVLDADGVR